MNVKRFVLSGIVVWLVGSAFGWLTCGWLFNWVYMIPPMIWKDPSMMMTPANMIGSALLGLLVSFIFVGVFAYLYRGIPGKGVKKGLTYGLIVWLIGAVSGLITMPFYMTIAVTVVVYWIIQALVLNLINGAIIGALYKER
ncbi:hypothetical protein KY339_03485 [Candidatus Woesearchaeota archaeon]|nr:hypothetical protein [Candidatus Woesearchaeota archaeon]